MSNQDRKKVKFKDYFQVNPLYKLTKWEVYDFIEMASIMEFTREPAVIDQKIYTWWWCKFSVWDTILARIEPCLQNWKTAYIKSLSTKIWFWSTEYIVFRWIENKTDNVFMYYLSLESNFRNILIKSMSWATGRQRVDNKVLDSLNILLPPLPVQQAIASILSKYDDLVENNNQRIKILEQEAELIYKEWFVKFKFPWHEKVKMIDSWTEFGMIPEGWGVRKVEELIEKISTGKKYDNKTTISIWKVPVIDQWSSWIIWYHNDEPWVFASPEKPIITFANHTCYQNIIMFSFSTIQNIFAYYPNDTLKSDIYWLHFHTNKLIKISAYKWHFPDYLSKKVLYPWSELPQQYWKIAEPMMIEKYYLQKENENLRKTRDMLLPKLISGEIEI